MWTIFKVFSEFVIICFCSLFWVFFPWGMWDLSFQTRDQTHNPCIASNKVLTTGPPRKTHLCNFKQLVKPPPAGPKATASTSWPLPINIKTLIHRLSTSSTPTPSPNFLLFILSRWINFIFFLGIQLSLWFVYGLFFKFLLQCSGFKMLY